ncbi:DUF1080 domain-containing protein [bacterium]|nr:DUF1080 domain-containing protein [bacterium]
MRMLASVACLMLSFAATAVSAEEGFTPLFDGKTLTGLKGDPELWKVEDGMVVGTTDTKAIKHNTFLATEKSYKNFVLRIKFKLRNGNSGVQVRSKSFPDHVVRGYQPDIAQARYTGILYEEGGRGILADVKPAEVAKHLKKGDWNQYVITCNGPQIKLEINGFTTVDYTEKSDKGATEGIIALQLHVGAKMRVWFKDIEIKELP